MRPLSCARLSIGNVLEFLCWKWKPIPELYSVSPDWFEYCLYMRSLFLVESFDFRPSNQYILVRVIPSFRFVKIVFVPGKSPSKYQELCV
jgi:hypothetical protein